MPPRVRGGMPSVGPTHGIGPVCLCHLCLLATLPEERRGGHPSQELGNE